MVRQAAITDLLASVAAGDSDAREEFFRVVYDEMKRIARAHVRRSARHGLTINPTTLVHETWLRFERADKNLVAGTAHFYNIVAQVMRQILFDLVDRKRTVKRGGDLVRTDLSDWIEEDNKPIDDLVALHLALSELQKIDPEVSAIVEWHYFAGLSVSEIAQIRGISERTVKRNLSVARALLHDALAEGDAGN